MAKKGQGKGGRPSKYTDDMPRRLIEFFNREAFEVETVEGKEIRRPCTFPTLARFAVEQGVSRETLHSWAHDTDEDGNQVDYEDRLGEILGSADGYNGAERIWRVEGRQIEFGSCPNAGDERKYQGRPHDLIGFDLEYSESPRKD